MAGSIAEVQADMVWRRSSEFYIQISRQQEMKTCLSF